jgi:hypothetical protein
MRGEETCLYEPLYDEPRNQVPPAPQLRPGGFSHAKLN